MKIETVLKANEERIAAEQAIILAISGEIENECSCTGCKSMCKRAPCLGTPSDILKLIQAGYIDKIKPTLWAAAIIFEKEPIMMVQIEKTASGCAFLNSNGLCNLHDTGLKPTEGRFSNHSPNEEGVNLSLAVAQTWEDDTNFPIVEAIINELDKVLPDDYRVKA